MRTLQLSASLACAALLAASDPASYRISGPYNHDNLSIFLIHGTGSGKTYLTLRDALAQKKVVVYETQKVNELAVENVSGSDVFVQGGDIVKGGQQDRVISNDFVLPARSGRLPISAFCVEPGRWTQRGAESARQFNSSTETIANPDMAIAVKDKMDQAEVWRQVAKTQDTLQTSVAEIRTDTFASGTGVASHVGGATETVEVRADASPSSLQLTLESRPVEKAVEAYLKALRRAPQGERNVIGWAFAVNGRLTGADVYASPDLFQAMWPKLLKSSAVEAVRSWQKNRKVAPPAVSEVEAFLREPEDAKVSTTQAGRIALRNWETGKEAMFESRDGDAWIHRNYIAK